MNVQIQAPYTVAGWNDYARVFASVTPTMQLAVYREACLHLKGDVVDCGSGAAKIAPILADKSDVMSYTGIDSSKEMVDTAQQILLKLEKPNFSILHSRIEEASGTAFTSAVSVQSYYSWPNPIGTLHSIFHMLTPGACFVLATPNQNLSIEILASELKKELIAHPDYENFLGYNLKLATNPQANFVTMDKLVAQVRQVGFQVQECHQQHLHGGMNFLVLRKGS